MLRNMNINKYFKVNLHCVNIQKNKAHQTALFIQFKEDNQTVLTLTKNVYIYK